jgi:hypothetical protein
VIFLTGDLVEVVGSGPGGPHRLQKPFRISDVLAVLREIFTAAPAEKVPN